MGLKLVISTAGNSFCEMQYWNIYVQKLASGEEEHLFLQELFQELNHSYSSTPLLSKCYVSSHW